MASQIDDAATHRLQKELKRGSPADANSGYWPPDRTRRWLSGSGLKGAQRPKYLPVGMPQFVEISAAPIKRFRAIADMLAQRALLTWPAELTWPVLNPSAQAAPTDAIWHLMGKPPQAGPAELLSDWWSGLQEAHWQAITRLRARTAASGHGWYLPDQAVLRLGLNVTGQRTVQVEYSFGEMCRLQRAMMQSADSEGEIYRWKNPTKIEQNTAPALMKYAQRAMKREALSDGSTAPLWFADLPPHLSNLHPHAAANEGAFGSARDQARVQAELAVVQWEESVRWLAVGWDGEDEYRHDLHFRFALDELLHSPAWAELAPPEREALAERVRMADTVYRRRSVMPTRVLDVLLPHPTAANNAQREKLLASWRAQDERFWFVWVQPLGL
jgi:hypothetical protein